MAWIILAAFLAAVLVHRCPAQVVINEIMYAPESPEPEWIELFNAGVAAVELEGWSIRDGGGGRGMIPACRIGAGAFVVITRDSAGLRGARSVRGAVVEVLLPSLNNNGDRVALLDSEGRRADSLEFSAEWGGADGRSLERRLHTYPAVRDTSWAASTSSAGATPGRKNAVTPSGFDIGIEALRFDPESALLLVLLRNVGTLRSARAWAVLYHDADDDGKGDRGEELDSMAVPPLEPRDSAMFSLAWSRPLYIGGEPGVVEVVMAGDERTADNVGEFTAWAPVFAGGVVINEIMFDPLPSGARSGAEYVEIHNARTTELEVAGWRLYDATLRAQATVRAGTPPVQPGGYLVLISDTTVFERFPFLRDSTNVAIMDKATFSLNQDEDDVVLRNASGTTVDSVHYLGDWHRPDLGELKGVAIERVSASAASNDRRNWSSSAAREGGTPGAANTLAVPVTESEAALAADPVTVSPDGDGHEDFTRITYRLPVSGARIVVTVYDRRGRAVRLLAGNEPAAAQGELIWDGRDDTGRPLPVGIYMMVLDAYDDAAARFMRAQATVVVARRL